MKQLAAFRRMLAAGTIAAVAWLTPCETSAAKANEAPKPVTFEAGKGTFLLNGEPHVVKAAELHYPRIPRPYWDQRIKQTKALGMNTVCLYVFWNAHEPRPGEFDFTGQNDLAAFVRLCQANGMNVILRPGPYVCAEWEMGGLPWWLLRKKDIRLRESDPYFLERVDIFQKEVAKQVKGLTAPEGGPIIMIQVENEYGSYGEDKAYVATIRDMLRKNFGSEVQMFQCDWSSNFTLNGLDDLIWTMNFGTGADIDQQFAHLKELRPDSPLMCSEFWSGWFDKWGANHETRPAADMIAGIDEMLSKGISFSLYMTHGGTNWGHWAGANSPGFAPDVTSYDYDAPISEAGHYTPKYHALRQTLSKYADGGKKLPKAPAEYPVTAIPEFTLTEFAPIFKNLPDPVSTDEVKTMEEFNQGFGSILYRTTLPALADGSIVKFDGHDYAQIFINGKYIGKLDRRVNERELRLPATNTGDTLDILVEAMGRINFGRAIKDYKGITSKVLLTTVLDGRPFTCDLRNWQVFPLPDELSFYTSRSFRAINRLTDDNGHRIPGIYRGTFRVKKPADTFLDFSTWGKGLVYVNGHPLGRIWEIGPQQTLYTPGCWLRKGENEIVVFDIVGPRETKVIGHKQPIIDMLQQTAPGAGDNERLAKKLLANAKPVAEGKTAAGNGWQTLPLNTTATGRYLVIEPLDAHDGGERVAIAEVYALGADGKRLSREPWTVVYADSEDTHGSNRTGDKVYDLQESTYWQTAKTVAFPHSLVLDLGSDETVTGIEVLPRAESGAPHAMASYRIYLIPASAAK